ncbi:MAG: PEP-CTERM sorting domain-containing protein [Halobacteria archaeon]|nr:PEP-CTERM sorting domain-containing protein [Halobacteria archaeon]
MKTKQFISFAGAVLLGFSSLSAQAVIIDLAEWAVNIDGVVSDPTLGDPIPAEVDVSLFDDITGLGSISITITGAGAHSFDAFFDHEFDEATNTFFNESGAVNGTLAAGQSWEIDEPGFVFGDIFTNFENSTLDNSNAVPAGLEDDVSMALGWDFVLGVGETATIDLLLSDTLTGGGFFLSQTDADSQASIFFSGSLSIAGGPVGVPEPSILLLMGIGLAGILVRRRRVHQA